MSNTTEDILKASVTKDDYNDVKENGPYHVMLPFGYLDNGLLPDGLPARLPAYWSPRRDFILRQTPILEGMWGSAINIAITKFGSLGWNIDGDVPLRSARGQDILTNACHQQGWVALVSRVVRDFLTTDNGAFIEVVHASSARGSRIIGLEPLDSLRCVRTGDPSIPVLYRDKQGGEHEMRSHQVLSFVDMPDPSDTWNGVGLCAASRAYNFILKLAALEQFVIEKVTGRRALALYIIRGLAAGTLDGIIKTAEADADQKGIQRYLGAILAGIPGEQAMELITIPFAELPDGFDRKQEWDMSLLAYANATGLDPQDLQPLTGQQLGAGAQSQVLNNKAKGRGLAVLRQGLTHALNNFVLAKGTTFSFTEKDYVDQKAAADVAKVTADTIASLVEKGIITAAQGLQMLVDADIAPKEFLPNGDQTPETSISDADGQAEITPTGVDVPSPTPATSAQAVAPAPAGVDLV